MRVYKNVLGGRNYLNYPPARLQEAINDVKAGRKSLREAQLCYNVPKSTLCDKLKAKHPNNPGRPPVFSKEEEKKLADAILLSAEWGFPLTELDIRKIIQHFLNRKGVRIRNFRDNMPGRDWSKNFLARHKTLTIRTSQNIKRNRAEVGPEVINDYFRELQASLEDVVPENLINYDETNFSDDPGRPKVISKRGAKHCDRVMDHSKTSISVMMAASAAGDLLPPFVVYKAKHRYVEWEENGPAGCRYSVSKSGWLDANTFVEWFNQIALPFFRNKRGKKVMIGDNLSSHITVDVINLCEENDIRFILLPPNSTHLCQPLDVSYFAPLKKSWRKILTEWKQKRKGPFQKSDFPTLLRKTLEDIDASSKKNIISGFRASGIVPWNPQEVLKRLPQRFEDAPAVNEDNNLLANTIVEFFKATRSPEPRTKTRRKRINIPAGQPITVPNNSRQQQTNVPETPPDQLEDSDDSDDLPLSRRMKKRTRIIESDNETDNEYSDQNETDKHTKETDVRIQETDNNSIIDVNSFVIVQVTVENTSKCKYYVGRVTQQYIEGTSQNYLINFLRSKKTADRVFSYFHYPSVADESIVARAEIIKILHPIALRRERFTFSNLPEDILLE